MRPRTHAPELCALVDPTHLNSLVHATLWCTRSQVDMGVRSGRGEMIYGDSTPERYDGMVRGGGALQVLLPAPVIPFPPAKYMASLRKLRACSYVDVVVQWVENLYDGAGKLIYPDHSSYEGDFKLGARHGRFVQRSLGWLIVAWARG